MVSNANALIISSDVYSQITCDDYCDYDHANDVENIHLISPVFYLRGTAAFGIALSTQRAAPIGSDPLNGGGCKPAPPASKQSPPPAISVVAATAEQKEYGKDDQQKFHNFLQNKRLPHVYIGSE